MDQCGLTLNQLVERHRNMIAHGVDLVVTLAKRLSR